MMALPAVATFAFAIPIRILKEQPFGATGPHVVGLFRWANIVRDVWHVTCHSRASVAILDGLEMWIRRTGQGRLMIDENGQENDSIKVQTNEAGVPYVMVAVPQVPQVRVLFDGVGLPYTIDEKPIDAGDEPAVVTIIFDSGENAEQVQRLLDGIH
jgi:hypothetical protein